MESTLLTNLGMKKKGFDSTVRRQTSGKLWENETFGILKDVFPADTILWQVTTTLLPGARPDFVVIKAGIVIECKACGLTPVQERVLVEHARRQKFFESLGMEYVWWVDRERNSLVHRTRSYLKNVFYNCLGEKEKFIMFLKNFTT